jgi:hypothetical protein
MIISYHDGRRYPLGNEVAHMVLECDDDLKPRLLTMMTTVASNSHRSVNLHSPFRDCATEETSSCRVSHDRCNSLPVFNLVGVEDNGSLLFISVPELILLWFFVLLPTSTFSFPDDAP